MHFLGYIQKSSIEKKIMQFNFEDIFRENAILFSQERMKNSDK